MIRNLRARPALLLVEDEPTQRFAIEDALLKAGHRVVSEPDADRAAELLRDADYPLAALITSVELHVDRSGWDLARLARQVRPSIPVIYMSRYSEEAWAAKGVAGSRLLSKLSDPAEVVAAVKALLKRASDAASAAPCEP